MSRAAARPVVWAAAVLVATAASPVPGAGFVSRGAAEPAAVRAPADPGSFVPRYAVGDTTRVRSRDMTLDEIIAKCVEGERTKLAGRSDLTMDISVRIILAWKERREIQDAAFLAYEEAGGFSRTVALGRSVRTLRLRDGAWVPDDEPDDEPRASVRAEPGDDREESAFTEIPFFLEHHRDYAFTLLDRTLEGDRVIFRIGFHPRSTFKPLPSGTVWVDTNKFRIIHEEFRFDDQNPFPLLLGRVNRVSRQWTELPGGEWVATKILGDVDLKGGWTGLIPDKASFAVLFENHRFDRGYDAARFGERKR